MRMIQQLKSQKRGLGGKRKAKVSFYELITVMSVMAYGNFYNKIRFIFSIYDFDCNKAIDEDEIAIMVICFIEGWGRITREFMPSRKALEKVANVIATQSDLTLDGKVVIGEIGTWFE